jgi:hypothetical protein
VFRLHILVARFKTAPNMKACAVLFLHVIMTDSIFSSVGFVNSSRFGADVTKRGVLLHIYFAGKVKLLRGPVCRCVINREGFLYFQWLIYDLICCIYYRKLTEVFLVLRIYVERDLYFCIFGCLFMSLYK